MKLIVVSFILATFSIEEFCKQHGAEADMAEISQQIFLRPPDSENTEENDVHKVGIPNSFECLQQHFHVKPLTSAILSLPN